MKKIISFVLLLSFMYADGQKNAYPPPDHWIATCMIGGNGIKHFFLLPGGEVQAFSPGGKPEPVQGLQNVVALAAGNSHMLALKNDGTVWAWGENDDYQLGNKTLAASGNNSAVPVQVTGIFNAVGISAIYNTSYALLADGTIRAWGNGNEGMTGDGKEITAAQTTARISARRLPVGVIGINNARAIAGAMALLQSGEIMTWGNGRLGRLGNGNDQSSSSPVKVNGIKNAIAISASADHALALLSNGEVWAWGNNYKGQLGNGAINIQQNDHSSVPVRVRGIQNAVAIAANYTCFALLKTGEVMGWGWGEIGALGSKRNDANSLPLKVPIPPKAIAIKAGNGHGFALMADGTLMGWGSDMVAGGVYKQTYTPIKITQVELRRIGQ